MVGRLEGVLTRRLKAPSVALWMMPISQRQNETTAPPPRTLTFCFVPTHPPKYEVPNQFAEVMRAQIKNVFFTTVGEDQQRQSTNRPRVVERGHFQSFPESGQLYSQGKNRWRAKILKRWRKECEIEKIRRWEDVRHLRRTSRSQVTGTSPPGTGWERWKWLSGHWHQDRAAHFQDQGADGRLILRFKTESYHCTVCCM